MSGNDHALAAFQARQNGFIPVRDNAIDGQRQALGQRQLLLGQRCVTRIVAREALVVFGQRRRRHREATTPLLNLLVTVLLSGFGFVQALQRTVVTLVQFPGLLYRQPGLIEFIKDVPQGVDGAFQHGSVGKIKAEAFFFQQLTC